VNLLDRVLLARADEQTAGALLPPGGRDSWDVGRARRKPGPKGPRRKLSEDQVRRIRRAKAGGETFQSIAERLGCSKNFIQRVCDGSAYGEIA
jgi:DNA invertase Pin-like site-specific DNA recombinase